MNKFRSFFYLVLALTLLFYGFPRFQLGSLDSLSVGFAILWSSFALLIIGSHLYDWLGVAKAEQKTVRTDRKQKQKDRSFGR